MYPLPNLRTYVRSGVTRHTYTTSSVPIHTDPPPTPYNQQSQNTYCTTLSLINRVVEGIPLSVATL